MKSLLLTILFLFSAVALMTLPPAAQAQLSVTMSPDKGEHALQAGGSLTDSVILTNEGPTPVRVKVTPSDWSLDEKGNLQFISKKGLPYSASGWIKVNPRNFQLRPHDHKEIRYTLAPPRDLPDAGYRTTLLIEFSPIETSPEGSHPETRKGRIEVKGRFAYFVYAIVGKPQAKARLDAFQVMPAAEGLAIHFLVENKGIVHFRTKGAVILADRKGEKVGEVVIPDVPVLPEKSRVFNLTYKEKKLPDGVYTASLRVDIGREELLGEDLRFRLGKGEDE